MDAHLIVKEKSLQLIIFIFPEDENLHGTLPSEIYLFDNLGKFKLFRFAVMVFFSNENIHAFKEFFRLPSNNIIGSLPTEIGSMDKLRK